MLVCRELSASNDQQITNPIHAAVESTGAEIVVLSQDQTGKSVGPRVAAKLNAGHVSGAIDLPDTSNGFHVNTNVFSGKAMAKVAVHSDKKVISLLPNSLSPEKTGGAAAVEEFSADLGEGKIVVKEMKSQGEGIPYLKPSLLFLLEED